MHWSLLFTIIAFVIYLVYNTIVIKKFGVPKSLSMTHYLWKGVNDKLFFAFPLMMFLMAGMLMPAWIEMSAGSPFQFLSFLAAAAIIFVGAAPSFKRSDLENSVHQWSAYLSAAFAILWIILVPNLWYIVAIVLALHVVVAVCTKTVKTSYIYWLESVAFFSTFISIVFYYFEHFYGV